MILTFKKNCGGSNALEPCLLKQIDAGSLLRGNRGEMVPMLPWQVCGFSVWGACLPPLPSEALRVRPAQSCRTGGGRAAKTRSSGHSPRRDREESQLLGTCFPSGQSCGFVGPVGCGGPAREVTLDVCADM